MQHAAFTGFGDPENITIRDVDDPVPTREQATVRVEASTLNHHDLQVLQGKSTAGQDDLSFVSGFDVAGVNAEVGRDVSAIRPDDRMIFV